MNKPSRIGPYKVLQLSLIDVFYLLVKNYKGRGGGVGVKTEGGLLLKLSSSGKEGLLERGGLNSGFKILSLLFFFASEMSKKKMTSVSIVCNGAIQNVFCTLSRFDF